MAIRRRRGWSPLGNLLDLDKQLSQMFGEGEESGTSMATWSPRVDVYESGDDLVFECEAPGVNKDDIDVSVENNRLTISGERREEKEAGGDDRDYYRTERLYGRFQRSFALPDGVDASDISAQYDEGVLKITLPQGAQTQRQSIDIE